MAIEWMKWIPWFPALAAVLCGVCCARKSWRRYAAAICIGSIALGFVVALAVAGQVEPNTPRIVKLFEWIHVGALQADFG